MRVLYVDTTTPDLVAAIVEENRIESIIEKAVGTRHSETLCSKIAELMKRTSLQFADIDAYACAVGPGSFTGIRIGVSTVKGYATAVERPYISVNCLKAIARSQQCGKRGCAVIDAGNGYYFVDNLGSVCPVVIPYDDARAIDAGKSASAAEYFDGAVELIRERYANSDFDNDLTPVYIRRSQAQITLENKERKL